MTEMLGIPPVASVPSETLERHLRDSHARTLALIQDLDDRQIMGPRLATVNPLLWEVGHAAWFHEHFILQRAHGCAPLLASAAGLYDSIAIAHDRRWDLPLPSRAHTLDYLERVLDALVARLPGGEASALDSYLYQFTTFHEDMHCEAYLWARQTLGYPRLDLTAAHPPLDPAVCEAGPLEGDVDVPGGTFLVGAPGNAPFVFDNEKWAHPVVLAPFRIARAPVTNAGYAAFVDDGGYRDARLWCEDGWAWRCREAAEHPRYWQPDGDGGWTVRGFDRIRPLPPHQPVIHVNWYEASAWCRWAGRRLPAEAEWEAAALAEPAADGTLRPRKRRWPWLGPAPATDLPAAGRLQRDPPANLDGRALGCVDVAAYPEGDSAFGLRQMLGNVWEWCDDPFAPYPGFSPDAYKEYSQTLFGHTRVLRGGAWTTRSRMVTGLYRNYFGPERSDVFAGFRTCESR